MATLRKTMASLRKTMPSYPSPDIALMSTPEFTPTPDGVRYNGEYCMGRSQALFGLKGPPGGCSAWCAMRLTYVCQVWV